MWISRSRVWQASFEQTAPRSVVRLVRGEMLTQAVDALGQQGNLNFGGAGIARATQSSGGGNGGINPASLAASLKRTRYTPPEFPSKALSQRLSGSVTVEYTVDTNGDPRDVRVVEATPPGVFDKAAIAAVKRWHYDPVIANGAPVEVPVRTSIRFELPK